jgi:hypothetical protein
VEAHSNWEAVVWFYRVGHSKLVIRLAAPSDGGNRDRSGAADLRFLVCYGCKTLPHITRWRIGKLSETIVDHYHRTIADSENGVVIECWYCEIANHFDIREELGGGQEPSPDNAEDAT